MHNLVGYDMGDGSHRISKFGNWKLSCRLNKIKHVYCATLLVLCQYIESGVKEIQKHIKIVHFDPSHSHKIEFRFSLRYVDNILALIS